MARMGKLWGWSYGPQTVRHNARTCERMRRDCHFSQRKRRSVCLSVWMQQSICCSSQHPSTQQATKYTFISSRDRVRMLPADMILGHHWIRKQNLVTMLGKSVTNCGSGNRTDIFGQRTFCHCRRTNPWSCS